MKFIAQYISINEASRATGVSHINISYCCHHRPHYKTAGGFIWMFVEEWNTIQNEIELIENLTEEEDEI